MTSSQRFYEFGPFRLDATAPNVSARAEVGEHVAGGPLVVAGSAVQVGRCEVGGERFETWRRFSKQVLDLLNRQ